MPRTFPAPLCLSCGGTSDTHSLPVHGVEGLVSGIFHEAQHGSAESWKSGSFLHAGPQAPPYPTHGRPNSTNALSPLEKGPPRRSDEIRGCVSPKGSNSRVSVQGEEMGTALPHRLPVAQPFLRGRLLLQGLPYSLLRAGVRP